ncbi:MAG: response regulator [Bacteriovoracaceae bacterium]|nr:response regulator [Bacteriovoracaceae bacterium]
MEHNFDKNYLIREIFSRGLGDKPILVIDDEIQIQQLLSQYLQKAYIDPDKIVYASNGKEALLKIQNQEFGLIIVDVLMPKMSGIQLVKELKSRAKFKNIPLVLISGNLDSENVKDAILLGVRNILVKPFNYDLFLEKVASTIDFQFINDRAS